MTNSNLYLKFDDDGKILYGSFTEQLDFEVHSKFFSEFISDYWVFNGTDLELVPDAEALRDAALAAEKAELEAREAEA
tara:strand:+ start:446 stop:679 length:234 start_codon:yes stop_codon:yes gene_type:complete